MSIVKYMAVTGIIGLGTGMIAGYSASKNIDTTPLIENSLKYAGTAINGLFGSYLGFCFALSDEDNSAFNRKAFPQYAAIGFGTGAIIGGLETFMGSEVGTALGNLI